MPACPSTTRAPHCRHSRRPCGGSTVPPREHAPCCWCTVCRCPGQSGQRAQRQVCPASTLLLLVTRPSDCVKKEQVGGLPPSSAVRCSLGPLSSTDPLILIARWGCFIPPPRENASGRRHCLLVWCPGTTKPVRPGRTTQKLGVSLLVENSPGTPHRRCAAASPRPAPISCRGTRLAFSRCRQNILRVRFFPAPDPPSGRSQRSIGSAGWY